MNKWVERNDRIDLVSNLKNCLKFSSITRIKVLLFFFFGHVEIKIPVKCTGLFFFFTAYRQNIETKGK